MGFKGEWVRYVPIDKAAKMVRAINEAKTEREHREAQLRLEGYKKRCDELGQQWPGCKLDMVFTEIDPDTGQERPTCCGEFLDWKEATNDMD